jgi:hypothetical protein
VHNGRVLCPALSFNFLHVCDGDEIYVAAPPAAADRRFRPSPTLSIQTVGRLRERFDAKFGARFRDPDAVFEQFRDASDPVTARESARLADLFRTRVEENPSACRKLFARLESLEGRRPVQAIATVLPEKALTPSTDLLPEVWRSPRDGSRPEI